MSWYTEGRHNVFLSPFVRHTAGIITMIWNGNITCGVFCVYLIPEILMKAENGGDSISFRCSCFFFGKSHAVIRAWVSINKISHDLYAFKLIWWCLLSIYTTPAQFRFIGVFGEIDFGLEKPKTHENSKNKYLSINMNYDFSLLSFHYFVSLSSRFSSC